MPTDPFDDDDETMFVLRDRVDDGPSSTLDGTFNDLSIGADTPDVSIGAETSDLSGSFGSLPDPQAVTPPKLTDSHDGLPAALSEDYTLLPNQVSLADIGMLHTVGPEPPTGTGPDPKSEDLLDDLESLFEKHALVGPQKKTGRKRTGEFLAAVRDLKESVGGAASSSRRKVANKKQVSAAALNDINEMLYKYAHSHPAEGELAESRDGETGSDALRRIERVESMLVNYLDDE